MAEVYQRLATHLGKLGMGYPHSPELLHLLKDMFSPSEAEVALALPWALAPFEAVDCETVCRRSDLPEEEIATALEAMAFLLVAEYGEEVWKYRDRWEQSQGEGQAFFLRKTLGLSEEGEGPGGEITYEKLTLSQLVKALRHDAWPVRMAALRILEEGSGESFGSLRKGSEAMMIDRVASLWEAWLRDMP